MPAKNAYIWDHVRTDHPEQRPGFIPFSCAAQLKPHTHPDDDAWDRSGRSPLHALRRSGAEPTPLAPLEIGAFFARRTLSLL